MGVVWIDGRRAPDDSDVMAEILSSELSADTELLSQRQYLRLHLQVPEGPAKLIALWKGGGGGGGRGDVVG